MERLTDRKTAAAVKSNLEGLQAKGLEISRIELEYIKLAEYENAEEDGRILPGELTAKLEAAEKQIERLTLENMEIRSNYRELYSQNSRLREALTRESDEWYE